MSELSLEDVTIPEDHKQEGEVRITDTKKHIPDANEVELNGVLVRRADLDALSYFTICTRTGKDKETVSFISVQVPKSVVEAMPQVNEKDHVVVHGYLRSYWNEKEQNHTTVIEAKDYQKATSALEERFGVTGRMYDESFNKLFVGGEITRLTTTKRGSFHLVIKSTDEKGTRYINCQLYARNPKKVIPQLVIGNRICGVGEVRTYTIEPKTPEEKKRFVQSYILLDILEV